MPPFVRCISKQKHELSSLSFLDLEDCSVALSTHVGEKSSQRLMAPFWGVAWRDDERLDIFDFNCSTIHLT